MAVGETISLITIKNNANHLKLPILYIPLRSCKYNQETNEV